MTLSFVASSPTASSRAASPLAASLERAESLNAIASMDLAGIETHGGPLVLVKDNIATRGMPLTAGSPFFAYVVAKTDATAVRLLRAAGGNPAVRTTLHELALGITGVNAWSGPILNPFCASRVAGGSSGGSAAALAVGLGDLSLVTDTGGSARIPAAHCGVIGFRPTTGRYPADGVVHLSPSRDTIGLMARDLRWIIWADRLLSGETTLPPSQTAPVIGIMEASTLDTLEQPIAMAYRRLCDRLLHAGYSLKPVSLEHVVRLDGQCGMTIAAHETFHALSAACATLRESPFDALVAATASADVAAVLQGCAEQALAAPRDYTRAIGVGWPALRAAFRAVFAGVSVLLTPTTPFLPPAVAQTGVVTPQGENLPVFPAYSRFTRPDSMAGLPSLSFPVEAGQHALPMGMMLSAPRWQDGALLRIVQDILQTLERSAG
ncbi:MAG: amidase family protein [Acetobacter sp.]|uniref:amidase family protein n=1 Tax=Acetobacter sp. TaxID=440 RepID=UPI0039E80F9B